MLRHLRRGARRVSHIHARAISCPTSQLHPGRYTARLPRNSLFVLVGGIALSACASDETVEVVFDPCTDLRIAVSSVADPADAAAVDAAMAEWSHVLPVHYEIVHDASPDVLRVRFSSGDSYFRAIYWDAVGTVEISRDRLAPADYPLAVAHELGHSFGLLHVDPSVRTSVMNVGNLSVSPTQDDAAEVSARWDSCRRDL